MSRTVVAIFRDRDSAEGAARQIKEQGLKTEDISIVARHEGGDDKRVTATMNAGDRSVGDRPVNDNISDGIVTGGILGGLAGLLIGAGSMAVPGLGIIAAAGPITGLLSGAATGGIVGGLIDLGIPEEKGQAYERDIRAGKIFFSMKADENKLDSIVSILRNNGAESVETY